MFVDLNSGVKPRAGSEGDILPHSSLMNEALNSLESLLVALSDSYGGRTSSARDRTGLRTGQSSVISVQNHSFVMLAECSLASYCRICAFIDEKSDNTNRTPLARRGRRLRPPKTTENKGLSNDSASPFSFSPSSMSSGSNVFLDFRSSAFLCLVTLQNAGFYWRSRSQACWLSVTRFTGSDFLNLWYFQQ